MLPYGRHQVTEEDIAAVTQVLRGDWLTTGPTVEQFERAISAVSGGHPVVTCSSGTAALHTAYAAAGVQPGDEVVTTPLTFVATASCASLLGATIVFADVEDDTGLIDPVSVAEVLTSRTKVVAGVDYAGHPCDYEALQRAVADVGALTVADAAHSIGSTRGNRPAGDLADVTTFSFFATKNITTAEGGAVVCRDATVIQRAREFRAIGLVRDPGRFRIVTEGAWHQEVHSFGLNYRLTDLACALGLSQLRRLKWAKQRRAAIVAEYNEALSDVDGVRTPTCRADVDPMWHLYPLRILDGRRREVYDGMRQRGIGVQVNYVPVYWHPVYADLGYKLGMCPRAESFYAEELSLPLYPELEDHEVSQVVDTLLTILKG